MCPPLLEGVVHGQSVRETGRSPGTLTGTTRFGVVLPVHDEERLLPAAICALERAIRHASLLTEVPIGVAVVLDTCTDGSARIAEQWRDRMKESGINVEIHETSFRNVGQARRTGCQMLLDRWSDVEPGAIWLASTDADSEVPRGWIVAQLTARHEGGQVWVGAVQVRDWSDRAPETAEAWHRQYEAEHLPVHGANFGIDGATYVAVGGFPQLRSSEDRALFERAVTHGAVIRGDSTVRVTTSSRHDARAPLGFAHALTSIEASVRNPTPEPALVPIDSPTHIREIERKEPDDGPASLH